MTDLSHFSIFRHPPSDAKKGQESLVIMPFLQALAQFVQLDDVEFGGDPPDFVFRYQTVVIGVELTGLVPKPFEEGGFLKKADFKKWQAETKAYPQPYHEFEWGEYTLRESLAAFAQQVKGKSQKVRNWKGISSEKWLLLHVGGGSPFGELVATRREDVLGKQESVADYFAKSAYEVSTICQNQHPFDLIFLFSGIKLLAFSVNNSNKYGFPELKTEILARGKNAPANYMDWICRSRSTVKHPLLLQSEASKKFTP